MDVLTSVLLLFAVAAPAGIAAAWFVSQGPSALAGAFRPYAGLGWPRGVQEDDPPRWNWDRRLAAGDRWPESQTSPTLTEVEDALQTGRPELVAVALRIVPGSSRRRA
jgi:hypothetical protein